MKTYLTCAVVAACMAMPAGAATLDFDVLLSGTNGGSVSPTNGTVASESGGSIFVYNTGDFGTPSDGGFCALGATFACTGDATVTFDAAVENLTFQTLFHNSGDTTDWTAYSGASVLDSGTLSSDGLVDLSSIGSITSLFFGNSGGRSGHAFAAFSFDFASSTTPVPLPAGLPLLVVGLGGLGLLRRKKRA